MQSDGTVGRVLLASLHQAIGEVLPARLEFYEQWLRPPDHPDEALRIASFGAMLSALQHEDDSQHVIARAGQYAAIRSFEQLSALRRAYLRILPRRIRARKAVGLVVRILPALYADARNRRHAPRRHDLHRHRGFAVLYSQRTSRATLLPLLFERRHDLPATFQVNPGGSSQSMS
jgi:hypothetical protein